MLFDPSLVRFQGFAVFFFFSVWVEQICCSHLQNLVGNDGIAHLQDPKKCAVHSSKVKWHLQLHSEFSQDWHALFWILRDVPLTASFERPADPKFLERLDEICKMDDGEAPGSGQGMDQDMPDMPDRGEAPEATEASTDKVEAPVPTVVDVDVAVGVEGVTASPVLGGATAVEAENVTEVGDEDDVPFDPESPEGPGGAEDFVPETVGYQLLQHVDSPEHEDPDEAP